MGKTGSYLDVLRAEKQFQYMIAANMVSRFGDSIDAIAYGWMVYEITGSKVWLSLIMGFNMVPTILFQPFSGALTEFFNKKHMVVVCDLIRGGIVCLTGLLLLWGYLKPWQLLVLTFINSTVEALRIPNGMAMIPHILDRDHYKIALSVNQGVCRAAELVGMGLAGAVIAVLGTGGALLVDAATFIFSGILLCFIKLKDEGRTKQEFHIKEYFASLKEGFSYFKGNRVIVTVCMICVALNITAVPIENLQAAYVTEILRLDVFAMSVGSTAMTLGMILGAFLLSYLSKTLSDRFILFWGGSFVGVIYFAYIALGWIEPAAGRYIFYAIAAFCFGFVNSLIGISVQILFMSKTPDELVGRVGSIFNALAVSSIPAGSFLLAGASMACSLSQIYAVTGVITIVLFGLMSRRKGDL